MAQPRHRQEIVNLARLRDDFRRGVNVAEPPASDGISFRKRIAGDDAFKRTG